MLGNPKHLSDTVVFADSELATLSQVRSRVSGLVRNAKAYKIPKQKLGRDLCNAIEYGMNFTTWFAHILYIYIYIYIYILHYIACGMIDELPTNDLEKNESGPTNQFPEDQMQELRNLIDGIDITILGKYTSISGTRYKLSRVPDTSWVFFFQIMVNLL